MPPFIDDGQVRSVLRICDLVSIMRTALTDFSMGRTVQPVREVLSVRPHGGYFAAMPACGDTMLGAKLLTYYPGNTKRGLPTHLATIALFDPMTGQIQALMDGRYITEARTAAVTAVATDLLAPCEASVLAILGSGAQARNHIEALKLVREFRKIRIWSRTPEHAARLADAVGGQTSSAEDAVREADVIVTATASTLPILRGDWLKSGALVNAIGWSGPNGRELDDHAMANVVVVDSVKAAQKEAGDILLSGASIYAELGELLSGSKPLCTGSTTIFKSVGLAVEDIAAAALVFQRLSTTQRAIQ